MGCRWKRLGQAKLDLQFLTIFATRGPHKASFEASQLPSNQKGVYQIWLKTLPDYPFQTLGWFHPPPCGSKGVLSKLLQGKAIFFLFL